jgi:hypothetical protein
VPTEIVLSDGKECHVETLGIFELDSVPLPHMAMFTYDMEMITGDVKQVELDLSRYETLPEKPDVEEHELVEGTPAWYKWREWQLVQAALLHNRLRVEAAHEYCEKIKYLILDKAIAAEDIPRIKTIEDWRKVCWAALVPPLERKHLAEILRSTFNASYDDEEIFDAMDEASKGMGSYNAIRLWENQIANQLGLLDWQYAQLPLEERGRRIIALKLTDWLEHLDAERRRKKR